MNGVLVKKKDLSIQIGTLVHVTKNLGPLKLIDWKKCEGCMECKHYFAFEVPSSKELLVDYSTNTSKRAAAFLGMSCLDTSGNSERTFALEIDIQSDDITIDTVLVGAILRLDDEEKMFLSSFLGSRDNQENKLENDDVLKDFCVMIDILLDGCCICVL